MSAQRMRSTIGTVITGTSTPEQVEANVKATEWKLTPEEKAEIDQIEASVAYLKSISAV